MKIDHVARKAHAAYVESVLAETARLTDQPHVRNTSRVPYYCDKRDSRQMIADIKRQIYKLRAALENAKLL